MISTELNVARAGFNVLDVDDDESELVDVVTTDIVALDDDNDLTCDTREGDELLTLLPLLLLSDEPTSEVIDLL